MITTLTVVHVIVSILLIVTVLLQFGRGAEAGFFSSTDSQGVFAGPGPSNILTKATTLLAIIFLVLAVVLANLRGQNRDSSVFDNDIVETATPLNAAPAKVEAPAEATPKTETPVAE